VDVAAGVVVVRRPVGAITTHAFFSVPFVNSGGVPPATKSPPTFGVFPGVADGLVPSLESPGVCEPGVSLDEPAGPSVVGVAPGSVGVGAAPGFVGRLPALVVPAVGPLIGVFGEPESGSTACGEEASGLVASCGVGPWLVGVPAVPAEVLSVVGILSVVSPVLPGVDDPGLDSVPVGVDVDGAPDG
jgi:hypothetical protein